MKVVALAGEADFSVISLAVRLGECVAVAIAANASATVLAQARAAGASRLIQLWDNSFAESQRDPLGHEQILAPVLSALGRQLESSFFIVPETVNGWLGPALAEELGVTHVSGVLDAALAPPAADSASSPKALAQAPPMVIVRRRCLQGVQRLRGPAIGVLCVLPHSVASSAKLPPVGNVVSERWDLARLGIGPVDLPRPLLRPILPERRSVLSGRTFDSLEALALRLRQDGLALPGAQDGG